jgi:plastocyanin
MRTGTVIGLTAGLWLAAIAHAAAGGAQEATIKLFQYQPKNIEVKAGTAVTWVNADDIEHSVTAGAPGKESGAFDSGFFKKGQSFTFTFTFAEPGTFSYFCKRHGSMKATVTVVP